MKYRAFVLIGLITLGPGAVLDAPAQGQSQPPAQQQQLDPPPVLTVPPGYRYDQRGRRDPFVNPIPKPVEQVPPPVLRPPGLKGVMVAETTIIGIVTSREPGMNVAVLAAPGGKTYFASPGAALYDAVVKDIRSDSVVFELTSPGKAETGKTPEREIVRKVRTTPGE